MKRERPFPTFARNLTLDSVKQGLNVRKELGKLSAMSFVSHLFGVLYRKICYINPNLPRISSDTTGTCYTVANR